MKVAYDRYHQKVCVCLDCHTSVSVPGSAWQIAKRKRDSKAAAPQTIPEAS
jgi:hypothetical protein